MDPEGHSSGEPHHQATGSCVPRSQKNRDWCCRDRLGRSQTAGLARAWCATGGLRSLKLESRSPPTREVGEDKGDTGEKSECQRPGGVAGGQVTEERAPDVMRWLCPVSQRLERRNKRRSQDEKCCPQLWVSKLPLGVRWEEWESVSWAPCLNWEVGRLCEFVVSTGTPV